MEYEVLGETGVKISSLCMGTMHFGGKTDEKMARKMFGIARESGVNIFDTANVYNDGRSEKILGKCIDDCRDEIIIISKVGVSINSGINKRGLSKLHIKEEVNKSLKRLNTDYIDIYFVHRFDNLTSIEETLKAMDSLINKGKVLYLGVSNWAAWQIEKSLGISRSKNLERFQCIQQMYNILKRQIEVEILPMAEEENLGVLTYNVLAGGLLTGKYLEDEEREKGRFVDNKQYQNRYGKKKYLEITRKFVEHAEKNNVNPVALAVAWVQSHPNVTAPLIGARNTTQLKT